jgi:hypothetical protein
MKTQVKEKTENNQVEKRRKLWYGWRKEAAKFFNISPDTADARFNASEPDLIEWLDGKMQRRNNAKITKEKLLAN